MQHRYSAMHPYFLALLGHTCIGHLNIDGESLPNLYVGKDTTLQSLQVKCSVLHQLLHGVEGGRNRFFKNKIQLGESLMDLHALRQ